MYQYSTENYSIIKYNDIKVICFVMCVYSVFGRDVFNLFESSSRQVDRHQDHGMKIRQQKK